MSYIGAKDVLLEIARGTIAGMSGVNKYGRAPTGLQTTATDVWDRADATPTQQIWVAPTTARVHNIVSTSTSDDGNPAGVGARTLRIYGLTSWTSKETSEDITMDGTSNVATSNSYVIIHRMLVLTKGATNVNVGTITATAVTDSTVTAVILPGKGQTEMAIYGIPTIQAMYLTDYYGGIRQSSGAAKDAIFRLLVNPEPNSELLNFLVKHTAAVHSNGSSYVRHEFIPYYKIAGPAIIKIQGTASAADLDFFAGFSGILVDN